MAGQDLPPWLRAFLTTIGVAVPNSQPASTKPNALAPWPPGTFQPRATQILQTLPVTQGPTSSGSSANFGRYPYLPSWLGNRGKLVLGDIQQTPEGQFYTTPALQNYLIKHEDLHGLYWNMGLDKDWQKAIQNLSPEAKAELIRRSNWGSNKNVNGDYSGSNMSKNGVIINPDEAFAYAGMYGFDNVPMELKKFFADKVMNPVAGPPLDNPAKQVLSQWDKQKKPVNPAAGGGRTRTTSVK